MRVHLAMLDLPPHLSLPHSRYLIAGGSALLNGFFSILGASFWLVYFIGFWFLKLFHIEHEQISPIIITVFCGLSLIAFFVPIIIMVLSGIKRISPTIYLLCKRLKHSANQLWIYKKFFTVVRYPLKLFGYSYFSLFLIGILFGFSLWFVRTIVFYCNLLNPIWRITVIKLFGEIGFYWTAAILNPFDVEVFKDTPAIMLLGITIGFIEFFLLLLVGFLLWLIRKVKRGKTLSSKLFLWCLYVSLLQCWFIFLCAQTMFSLDTLMYPKAHIILVEEAKGKINLEDMEYRYFGQDTNGNIILLCNLYSLEPEKLKEKLSPILKKVQGRLSQKEVTELLFGLETVKMLKQDDVLSISLDHPTPLLKEPLKSYLKKMEKAGLYIEFADSPNESGQERKHQ